MVKLKYNNLWILSSLLYCLYIYIYRRIVLFCYQKCNQSAAPMRSMRLFFSRSRITLNGPPSPNRVRVPPVEKQHRRESLSGIWGSHGGECEDQSLSPWFCSNEPTARFKLLNEKLLFTQLLKKLPALLIPNVNYTIHKYSSLGSILIQFRLIVSFKPASVSGILMLPREIFLSTWSSHSPCSPNETAATSDLPICYMCLTYLALHLIICLILVEGNNL